MSKEELEQERIKHEETRKIIEQFDKEQKEREKRNDMIAEQIFEIYRNNHITLYDVEYIEKRINSLIHLRVNM